MTSLALQRTSTKNLTEEQLQALVHENSNVYGEYFDEDYLKSIVESIYPTLVETYFRPEFIGFENYPQRNQPNTPLIFASNHSGMAFPWDAMVFGSGLYQLTQAQKERFVRVLVSPALSEIKLMNPYMIEDVWKRVGGIDATSLNFETLMHNEEADLVIYPEGVDGIGKGFNRRYELQYFSTSFIRMALKYKTDIFPIYSINGEYINPHSYRSKIVNFLSQKIGIPYIPIGFLTLLIPIFPWIFYFGMPSAFFFVLGKRIEPHKMTDKPFEDMTREEIGAVRDQVHALMQGEITEKVKEYGQKPYNVKEFFKKCKENWRMFWSYFPMTWCLLFAEHERQYKRFKKTGQPVKIQQGLGAFFVWLVKNPFFIFYFLPVIGWIPLVIRGYTGAKRPPKK